MIFILVSVYHVRPIFNNQSHVPNVKQNFKFSIQKKKSRTNSNVKSHSICFSSINPTKIYKKISKTWKYVSFTMHTVRKSISSWEATNQRNVEGFTTHCWGQLSSHANLILTYFLFDFKTDIVHCFLIAGMLMDGKIGCTVNQAKVCQTTVKLARLLSYETCMCSISQRIVCLFFFICFVLI